MNGTEPQRDTGVAGDDEIVTVIRLVPVAHVTPADGSSAIVANLGHARMRKDGESIVLIVREAGPGPLRDIKVTSSTGAPSPSASSGARSSRPATSSR